MTKSKKSIKEKAGIDPEVLNWWRIHLCRYKTCPLLAIKGQMWCGRHLHLNIPLEQAPESILELLGREGVDDDILIQNGKINLLAPDHPKHIGAV
jgi:hypothetical protein